MQCSRKGVYNSKAYTCYNYIYMCVLYIHVYNILLWVKNSDSIIKGNQTHLIRFRDKTHSHRTVARTRTSAINP